MLGSPRYPTLRVLGGSEESAFLGDRVNSDTRGEGKRLAHQPPPKINVPLKRLSDFLSTIPKLRFLAQISTLLGPGKGGR